MTGNAHLFASIALIFWLPLSLLGPSLLRPPLACAALMVGAVMFLPVHVAFDLRGMRPIGKEEMASLGLLLASVFHFDSCRRNRAWDSRLSSSS